MNDQPLAREIFEEAKAARAIALDHNEALGAADKELLNAETAWEIAYDQSYIDNRDNGDDVETAKRRASRDNQELRARFYAAKRHRQTLNSTSRIFEKLFEAYQATSHLANRELKIVDWSGS